MQHFCIPCKSNIQEYINRYTGKEKIMHENLLSFYQKRRSIYALGNTLSLPEEKITHLVSECLKQSPTAFNSQSGRVVILYGAHHQKLWRIVLSHLQKLTPADKFPASQKKIASFARGFGTILFFEDEAVVTELQQKFPLYKDAFPSFSCQSSGMLQYMIWTALAAEDIGASLQHYNPLIDADVKDEWQLPTSWQLMSQMPFGNIEALADIKDFLPLETRFKVFT